MDEFYNEWPEISANQARFSDQYCVNDQKDCPSTIVCPNSNDYVCPDGKCVENEFIVCK